ncbi:DUF1133 family protein [Hafnia alvei]|uniref:DUF1133 family protein n=1 Tax=Hafnia alvei TaxID=569 RepID=UPI002430B42C|nr:DUF1133 family protein [Hafnia alvei]
MIYPDSIGLVNTKESRLRTLESIWIQGKLRMWGRWSSVGCKPEAVTMFKRLLGGGKITQDDLSKAVKYLRKNGCSSKELESWMNDLLENGTRSSLTFCTDDEGRMMDGVIAGALHHNAGLLYVLKQRYVERLSQRKIAEEVQKLHPEWCERTCRSRVSAWLAMAERALYLPMNDVFELNAGRFYG